MIIIAIIAAGLLAIAPCFASKKPIEEKLDLMEHDYKDDRKYLNH